MIDINTLRNDYIFKVYDERTDEEVCRIKYTVTIREEIATIDIFSDNIPLDIKLGDKSTNALLIFLRDRVLPPNRMFLAEELAPLGINPSDWVSLIQLNEGKTYTDHYYVLTEKLV